MTKSATFKIVSRQRSRDQIHQYLAHDVWLRQQIQSLHAQFQQVHLEGETSNPNGSHRFFETTAAKVLFGETEHISVCKLCEMVHLEGETSNALFDELAGWNNLLQQSIIDFEELAE